MEKSLQLQVEEPKILSMVRFSNPSSCC
jgi:hypothetical protein